MFLLNPSINLEIYRVDNLYYNIIKYSEYKYNLIDNLKVNNNLLL